MHESFESYKFHQRKQEPTENIKTYVAALHLKKTLILASYETLIRDQVAVGVRDDCVRENCYQISNSLSTSAYKLVEPTKPLNNRQRVFSQALILSYK